MRELSTVFCCHNSYYVTSLANASRFCRCSFAVSLHELQGKLKRAQQIESRQRRNSSRIRVCGSDFGNLSDTNGSDESSVSVVLVERTREYIVAKKKNKAIEIEMNSHNQGSEYIPRRELTLAERVAIIRQHMRGVRIAIIARDFNSSKQQVRRTLHRKEEYLALWARNPNEEVVETVRRLRTPLLIATGRILYEWVIRARYYMDVTDDHLRTTGRAVANHIGYKDFKSNNRWLNRFKNKYKLHNMKLKGVHRGALDPKHLKTLDIASIIESIQREDPSSLPDFERGKEAAGGSDATDRASQPHNVDSPEPEFERESSPEDQGIEADQRMEMEVTEPVDDLQYAKEITTYREAISLLGPIEQFALLKENIRAVGLINQLENLFRDEMANGKK